MSKVNENVVAEPVCLEQVGRDSSFVKALVANIVCKKGQIQEARSTSAVLGQCKPTYVESKRLLDNRIDNVGIIYLLSCQTNLALRSNEDTTIPVRRQKFRI